ncbi:flagellar assembly protein FliX [Magnetospirillum molischianum]|uniref:Flagellar assembly protein fliX n=1 Tax=Magnetospirillum molischianum DSM 120 TaxID=1150626 RepID=H8FQK3_MAGML|nr:flagellar assembly protein FliX [Magnetospirillum molischianum]CCG40641.1 Flagellar assembly protein fliX [Magnetospirillum molischianum DSM 120]
MKISGVGSKGAASGPRRTDKNSKTGEFRRALVDSMDQAEDAHGVEAPVGIGGVDALLLVQQTDDRLEREIRHRLIRRGEDLLDGLEALRHGLLMGEIPLEKMTILAQTIRVRRESSSDTRLSALLDEVELRVEVELAKLSRRG